MKTKFIFATTATLLASTAFAGGIDRSGQSVGVLFETGNVIQLNMSFSKPTVEGNIAYPLKGNLPTGDAAGDYSSKSIAVKEDFGNFSLALIYDEPFGAFADYPTDKALGGLTAKLDSTNISLIGKAKIGENVSVFAGVAMQTLDATMENPSLSDPAKKYAIDSETSNANGWLAGAAYEKSEIGLRIDATYRSQIDHKDVAIIETTARGPAPSTITVSTPQSFNLNVQTGINEKTLIFAGARWVDWSAFEVAPTIYGLANGGEKLVSYTEDTITYTMGVGRKITDSFSLLGSIGYEKSTDETSTMLSPTNGRTTYNLGAQYTVGGTKIRAGVSYAKLGDAEVPSKLATFEDNTGVGFGLQLTQSF